MTELVRAAHSYLSACYTKGWLSNTQARVLFYDVPHRCSQCSIDATTGSVLGFCAVHYLVHDCARRGRAGRIARLTLATIIADAERSRVNFVVGVNSASRAVYGGPDVQCYLYFAWGNLDHSLDFACHGRTKAYWIKLVHLCLKLRLSGGKDLAILKAANSHADQPCFSDDYCLPTYRFVGPPLTFDSVSRSDVLFSNCKSNRFIVAALQQLYGRVACSPPRLDLPGKLKRSIEETLDVPIRIRYVVQATFQAASRPPLGVGYRSAAQWWDLGNPAAEVMPAYSLLSQSLALTLPPPPPAQDDPPAVEPDDSQDEPIIEFPVPGSGGPFSG